MAEFSVWELAGKSSADRISEDHQRMIAEQVMLGHQQMPAQQSFGGGILGSLGYGGQVLPTVGTTATESLMGIRGELVSPDWGNISREGAVSKPGFKPGYDRNSARTGFYRINEKVFKNEGEAMSDKEPLDELRLTVARWLYN